MIRLSILTVLSAVLLLLVACQPVLLPTDAALPESGAANDEPVSPNTHPFVGEVYKVGSNSWGMAVEDLDGDGLPDLAISDAFNGGIGVFLNVGDGSFETGATYATGEGANSVTPIDVEGDGDLDLAVANGASNSLSLLINDGEGLFEHGADLPTGVMPWWVVTADVNVDGLPDLVYVHDIETAGVFVNDGDGGFHEMIEYLVREETTTGSVEMADVDGDGMLDMLIRLWPDPVISVLRNAGDGTFGEPVDYAVTGELHGVYPADLNGDGAIDVAVPSGGDGEPGLVHVLLNDGSGAFQPATSYATGDFPLDVARLDLDGDDDVDMLVTNCGSSNIGAFMNDGSGRFQLTDEIGMRVCPVEIVVRDLDGSPGQELIVSGFDGVVMVMPLPEGSGAME